MTQINQYATEILPLTNPIRNEDFLDVDKLIDGDLGIYESQKMKYGTLITQLATDNPSWGQNIANDDLTFTGNRTHNADNNDLFFENLATKQNVFTGSAAPVKHNIVNADAPAAQTILAQEIQDGGAIKRAHENGSRMYNNKGNGQFWFGDTEPFGSLEGNPAFHAVFSNFGNKKTVFTDVIIPPTPTTDINDSIVWFRSTSKGVLFPNLTTAQRNSIPTPRLGLVVYNSTTSRLELYNGSGGTGWTNL